MIGWICERHRLECCATNTSQWQILSNNYKQNFLHDITTNKVNIVVEVFAGLACNANVVVWYLSLLKIYKLIQRFDFQRSIEFCVVQ